MRNNGHSRLSESIDQFFDTDVSHFVGTLDRIEARLPSQVTPTRNDTWTEIDAAFCDSRASCSAIERRHEGQPDVLLETQKRFRRETDRWFQSSWFGRHARTKPGGFAGDYEMLCMVYDNPPFQPGVGGYLDLSLSQLPLARAVRARLRSAEEFLNQELLHRSGDVRILNVASGPCREYLSWTEPRPDLKLHVTCLDNDQRALDYVEAHVQPKAAAISTMTLARYNALRTKSAATTVRKFGRFDILYSVGLCDYIPDKPLIGMLSGWRQTLTDNGVLYVAFKDCERYDSTPYQWHLDWHFLQRTEQDVYQLFDAAGFDVNCIETTRDDTGIILNFICRHPSKSRIRVDGQSPLRHHVGTAQWLRERQNRVSR